jgi:hypothetical protein
VGSVPGNGALAIELGGRRNPRAGGERCGLWIAVT